MSSLFRRAKNSQQASAPSEEEPKKAKGSWKRPANTAFKQQRLKAWQPILTPKTVLPTLLIIGIIFAPIGALLITGSNKVTEITIDYTGCDQLTPASNPQDIGSSLVTVPNYNYRLRSSESGAQFSAPQYAFVSASSNTSSPQCIVQFEIPFNVTPTVLLYYKLTNFFQNHRRYVQSYDAKQLNGDHRTVNDLKNGNCKPVANNGDKVIYPCGLIANSVFNDTFSGLTLLNPPSGASPTYNFSETGIAWPGEAKKIQPDACLQPFRDYPPSQLGREVPQWLHGGSATAQFPRR